MGGAEPDFSVALESPGAGGRASLRVLHSQTRGHKSRGKPCSGPWGHSGVSAGEDPSPEILLEDPPIPCCWQSPPCPGCLSCHHLIEPVKIQLVPGDGGARSDSGLLMLPPSKEPGADTGCSGVPAARPQALLPPLGQRLRPATNTPGGSGDSQKPVMGCCLFVFS